MYFGQRTAGMYNPQDTKKAMWGGSIVGRDTGEEMAKGHEALDAQDAAGQMEYAQNRAASQAQNQHEMGLQAAEQQRRMYDSQTARMGQQQKFGLLGGLLRGGGGMGGGVVTRTYGDVPASQRYY